MNKPLMFTMLMSFIMIMVTLMSRQQHMLPTLLCLEGLILIMIFYLPLITNYQSMKTSSLLIIMLTMSASSASIGLMLLVMMSRKEGNDSNLSHSTFTC